MRLVRQERADGLVQNDGGPSIGRVRTYCDSNLVPNTFVLSQYRNQFNSLRAAL